MFCWHVPWHMHGTTSILSVKKQKKKGKNLTFLTGSQELYPQASVTAPKPRGGGVGEGGRDRRHTDFLKTGTQISKLYRQQSGSQHHTASSSELPSSSLSSLLGSVTATQRTEVAEKGRNDLCFVERGDEEQI